MYHFQRIEQLIQKALSSLSLSFPFRFRWADRLSPST